MYSSTSNMMPGGLDSTSSPVDNDAGDNKKRSRDTGDEDYRSPEDLSKMSRSERKRHREKKRRSDVNSGFDDLMNLLVEIDPTVRVEAEEKARRGQWKGSIGAQEDNLLSRVDLITRTVGVLRRVHRENEERKVVITELTRGSGGTGTWQGGRTVAMNDEITRMLPMLNSSVESLARRPIEQSTLFQQTALGQTTMRDPLVRRSLEHSTLYQQAALGQTAMIHPRAASAGLFRQQSLSPFGSGSSPMPPGTFLGLQGLNTLPGGSGASLDISSVLAERNRARNRAAIDQTYLKAVCSLFSINGNRN